MQNLDGETSSIMAMLNPETPPKDDTETGDSTGEDTGEEQGQDTGEDTGEEQEQDTGEAEEPKKEGIDYEQLIPMSTGEKVTLGELKDVYQQQASRELAFTQKENSLLTLMDENRTLLELTGQLPPQVREQFQARQMAGIQREAAAIMEAIPAWSDPLIKARATSDIMALGLEYGLLSDFESITNHRAIKLLNDFVTLRNKVMGAKATLKPLQNKRPFNSPAPIKNKATEQARLVDRAKKTHTHADEISAISSLL